MMVHSPLPVGCAGSSSTQELLGDEIALVVNELHGLFDAVFDVRFVYDLVERSRRNDTGP